MLMNLRFGVVILFHYYMHIHYCYPILLGISDEYELSSLNDQLEAFTWTCCTIRLSSFEATRTNVQQ